jgi:hypothetical protein
MKYNSTINWNSTWFLKVLNVRRVDVIARPFFYYYYLLVLLLSLFVINSVIVIILVIFRWLFIFSFVCPTVVKYRIH